MASSKRCFAPTTLLITLLSIGNKARNFVLASVDPSSDFIYRQSFHFDFSSPDSNVIDDDQNPLFIASSTSAFRDQSSESRSRCSYVSSPTIVTSVKSAGTPWSLLSHSPLDLSFRAVMEVRDENDDDQDEDNDDDDGHSSMLSANSLQKKITASAVSSGGKTQHMYKKKVVRSNIHGKLGASFKNSFSSRNRSIWMIRGGATSVGSQPPLDWIRQVVVSAMESSVGRSLLVSAVVTLVFEACIGHILEFLKIVMQTATNDTTTYLQVIRTITAEKGIAGLWDGFCPWGIVQAVCKGAVFGLAHASALQALKPLAEKGIIPMALALTLAGGIGGGFQGYVLSPTLLLKTRVMTNPVFREKMSALRTTLLSFTIGYDVVKTEGLGALMKGANVFATKRVFDWASRYFFADLFEDLFVHLRSGSSLSVAEKSIASLLGGVFSTLVTLPLDVLVAKTQDAKKAGVKVSPLKLFQDELREKGWNGVRNAYMRGFEARLLHVCLTTVVIKTGTPLAYEAIFGGSK